MKQTLIAIAFFAISKTGNAQVSDNVVKVFGKFLCNCIDTVDFNQPEEALVKQFKLCRTISLTNLLNERLVGPEILTDEKLMADFDKKNQQYLADSCKAIQRLVETLNKEPEFEETNAEEIFTPVSFFETYELKKGETNKRLHVYNNLGKDIAKFQRVVDIRWTFKNEEDALKWHAMNLKTNSEGGAPVKDQVMIKGAINLKVYREAPGTAEMMKAMGVGQHHHYFIFVYKNIVCKIFVATDEKTNTVEAIPFAIAAVTQLQTVIK